MAFSRREFLMANAVATVSLAAKKHGISPRHSSENKKTVRVGVVGTGNRGRGLLGILLNLKDLEIPALCDINRDHLAMAQDMVIESGRKKPEGYSRDEHVFKKLMERDDIDAVIIATYWEWHAPMAVYGMKTGKYVGVEVPAAYTLEECWELVNTYEETRVPCMMLENWSFRRDNLAVLNMIRKGLLGKIETVCDCGWDRAKGGANLLTYRYEPRIGP